MTTKKKRVDDGLPMPRTSARRLERREWEQYRERQAHHRVRFPDYDRGWRRPAATTAEHVWKHLNITISTLLPEYDWLKPDEMDALVPQAMRALVVVLDAALMVGERGGVLTKNTAFDTLARHWSDHYRAAIENGPAEISYDMTADTLRASRRDLLRNGIRLDALWKAALRGAGLYRATRHPRGGYTVKLDTDSPALQRFREIVGADPEYRRPSDRPRLLRANETAEPQPARQEVAAEWAHNIVTTGKRSADLIRRLEAARVYLDVPVFLADLRAWEVARDTAAHELQRRYGVNATLSTHRPPRTFVHKGKRRRVQSERERHVWARWRQQRKTRRTSWLREVRLLLDVYDKKSAHLAQELEVRDQLQTLGITEGLVEIRSGFFQINERRYYPAHFWPLEVTKKDERTDVVDRFEQDDIEVEIIEQTSRRGRWFRARSGRSAIEHTRAIERAWPEVDESDPALQEIQPLVGYDVSSSQLQILAVLLGHRELEEQLRQQSIKVIAADWALAKGRDPRHPFTLSADADRDQIEKAGGKAIMTLIYGSEPKEIAREVKILGDEENLKRLFRGIDGVNQVYRDWLPACRAVAEQACRRDSFAGVVLRDPYGRALVRWNPVRRVLKHVSSDGFKVYYRPPVGAPNDRGDYPVDKGKLTRKISPGIVHVLDAAFMSFVVEALNARGVTDIVSIHDCWLVAAEAEPELLEAVEAAGEPWLRSLGPVYEALIGYLTGTKHEARVREWKRTWERRVALGNDWPRLKVSEEHLVAQDVR